jgi:hypothetical protein
MPVQLTQPRQQIAAATAVILLAGILAAPVLAAPERDLMCSEDAGFSPALSATELSAIPVSSSEEMLENHLLKPRAEAAVRGAFAEQAEEDEAGSEAEEIDTDESVVSEQGIPRASEGKRPIYKRQMYRRDI